MNAASGHRRSTFIIGLFVLISIHLPSIVGAQETVRIEYGECAGCAIRVDDTLTIGDLEGPGVIPGYLRQLHWSRTGTFWLVTGTNGAPLVFDRHGRFLRRSGGAGEGPNEFRSRLLVADGTRGIYILDPAQGRLTIQDRRGSLVETHPISVAGPRSMVVFSDGSLVVADDMRTQDRAGFPLHHFSSDGGWLKSFGWAASRSDTPILTQRILTSASDSTFWAAHVAWPRYMLWSKDGRLLRALDHRGAEWYYEHGLHGMPTPSGPPAPRTVGLWQDGDVLWIVSTVADLDWRAAVGNPVERNGRPYYPIRDEHRYLDTVVEALDLTSGQVVASKRLDPFMPVVTSGFIATADQLGADGRVYINVMRLNLVGLPTPARGATR